MDANGNIIVAGITSSPTLPPRNFGSARLLRFGRQLNRGDAFVAQLNPAGSGSQLVYLPRWKCRRCRAGDRGGCGRERLHHGDDQFNQFPDQKPNTANFSGSSGNRLNPMGDIFLTKLSGAAGQLVYSTDFGVPATTGEMAVTVRFHVTLTLPERRFPIISTHPGQFVQKGFKGTGGNLNFPGTSGPLFAAGRCLRSQVRWQRETGVVYLPGEQG